MGLRGLGESQSMRGDITTVEVRGAADEGEPEHLIAWIETQARGRVALGRFGINANSEESEEDDDDDDAEEEWFPHNAQRLRGQLDTLVVAEQMREGAAAGCQYCRRRISGHDCPRCGEGGWGQWAECACENGFHAGGDSDNDSHSGSDE